MRKRVIDIRMGYIADSIIEVKKKRFNEFFTTEDEIEVVRQCIEKRSIKKNLSLKFTYIYPKQIFNIVNGIIVKTNNEVGSLKESITDVDVVELVYDERFIYLCLCEMIVNRIYDSVEHNCSNCCTECCGTLNPNVDGCFRWSYDFKGETRKALNRYL